MCYAWTWPICFVICWSLLSTSKLRVSHESFRSRTTPAAAAGMNRLEILTSEKGNLRLENIQRPHKISSCVFQAIAGFFSKFFFLSQSWLKQVVINFIFTNLCNDNQLQKQKNLKIFHGHSICGERSENVLKAVKLKKRVLVSFMSADNRYVFRVNSFSFFYLSRLFDLNFFLLWFAFF